ncbi:MAG: pilus assembly protein PilM, partial [Actinomycetota bacterium]|nr:pilus assembly protein PilM [Actinomycetota bacterium]
MFKSRRQDETVVGLEMDPSHIAAAEVRVNGHLSVKKGGIAHLRAGILRDGEVVDAAALSDELRSLFAEHELGSRVRIGVANQRIVVRTLDLPLVNDPKALAEAVRASAPDHIPVPMDDAVLDFQPLGTVETPAGPRTR